MKKFVFTLLCSLLFTSVACGEDLAVPDYSLMNAPLISGCVGEIEMTQPSFFLMSTTSDSDQEIYNAFSDGLCADNISYENIGSFTTNNGFTYYGLCIPVRYSDTATDLTNLSDEISDMISARTREIEDIYYKFAYDNPELYYLNTTYLSGSGYNVNSRTGAFSAQINFVAVIGHNMNGIDLSTSAGFDTMMSKYTELDTKLTQIAENLSFPGMTDVDKLLLAHDYITDNCVYYTDADEYHGDAFSYNSYGAIINEQAVCQAYSLAYKALLQKMGYAPEDIKCVSSDVLNHMWNLVKLNDNWYHIDCTWDDPTRTNSNGVYDMLDKSLQITLHDYFLISHNTNYAQRLAGHPDGFDMFMTGYDSSLFNLANDTSYESGYIFSDIDIPGNISYSDGNYTLYTGKLYSNRDYGMYFNFNSLNSPKYIFSQPCLEDLSSVKLNALTGSHIRLFACSEKEIYADTLNVYICFYDSNKRLISTRKVDYTMTSFSGIGLSSVTVPENAAEFKFITTDTNLNPVANVPCLRAE